MGAQAVAGIDLFGSSLFVSGRRISIRGASVKRRPWEIIMQSEFSRREFIAGLGALAGAKGGFAAARFQSSSSPSSSSSSSATPSSAMSPPVRLSKSPFKIAVINDEISQDFGHACEVASQQFGMECMELRSMGNKDVANLDG